ncbi:MAG: hypothetical protein IPH32_07155 [Bacteroidetes bacterium]|nr:hypothetical protein [Bacteroidota bacterium]
MHILRVKKQIEFTQTFELNPSQVFDFRSLSDIQKNDTVIKPYYQVFADKLGFTPNVSCLDALFNVGLETKDL